MKDKKELILVILLGISGFILWNIYYDSYEKLYTIGQVVNKQTGMKSGTVVIFEFFHKSKKVEGGTGIGDYSVKVGEKYIVEFAKDKVDLSKALFYYPIPDTIIIDIPTQGWTEIPDDLKQYRRKRMEIFGLYDKIFKN